jgi:hypothetical protein
MPAGVHPGVLRAQQKDLRRVIDPSSSTSEPAAPNPDARLLLPRYNPVSTLPKINSKAVTTAPVQTSCQEILARGMIL